MKPLSIWLAGPWAYAGFAESSFSTKCEAFNPQMNIYNSTLTVREFVSAGTNISLADNDKSCGTSSQVVSADLCRIALHIPTSNRSSITMELWLPETWQDGRVLATGNGGIAGCTTSFCYLCCKASLRYSLISRVKASTMPALLTGYNMVLQLLAQITVIMAQRAKPF